MTKQLQPSKIFNFIAFFFLLVAFLSLVFSGYNVVDWKFGGILSLTFSITIFLRNELESLKSRIARQGDSLSDFENFLRTRDRLFGDIHKMPSEEQGHLIKDIIQSVERLNKQQDSINEQPRLVTTRLKETDKFLKSLIVHEYPLERGERLRYAIKTLEEKDGVCHTVGYNDVKDWWGTSAGRDYVNENKKFLMRSNNNQIQRIHIIDQKYDHLDEDGRCDLAEWIKYQHEIRSASECNVQLYVIEKPMIKTIRDMSTYGKDEEEFCFFCLGNVCTSSTLFRAHDIIEDGGIALNKEKVQHYLRIFHSLKSIPTTVSLNNYLKSEHLRLEV
jgi:hypothetical protein